MTQRRFDFASKPAARTAVALSVLALAGIGISEANVEDVVARNFTAALEAGPAVQRMAKAESRALVSGSEAFWLAQKRRHDGSGAIEPAAWSAPLAAGLAVGDRITISGEKSERVLEVVAIADVEPAPGAATDASAAKQIAVTCRDLSTPERRLTTFLAPAETAPAASRTPRSL